MDSKHLLVDFKDSISPRQKRMLRRMVGRNNVAKDNVIIRDGNWVARKSVMYNDVFTRKLDKEFDSNILSRRHFPTISYSKDCFIEERLRSGFYTFEDMLVIKNPYNLAPLTALAVFQTDLPCRVQFVVKGDRHTDNVTGLTGKSRFHRVPILGLYPGRINQVLLRLVDDYGMEFRRKYIKIPTKPLPQNMENMVRVDKQTKDSANTLTFVYGGDTLYPYAFDSAGDIRYYIERTPKAYGLFPLSGGKFLFSDKHILKPTFHNPHATNVMEMDFLGRIYRVLNVEKGLHHDACEMPPDGNILGAASSLKGFNEDAIIEINRRTGRVIKSVELGDLFDDTYKTSVDWAHINTVDYNVSDNTVLASLRNLHSVVKIDWWTGELIWVFANPEFFRGTNVEDKVLTPVGEDMEWFFQAHASYELKENLDGNPNTRHIIIFDNHWHMRRPVAYYDEDPLSYVRIYTINERERTVSLFRKYPCVKSKIRSNGILDMEKNRVFSMCGYLAEPDGDYDGKIYEFDYESGEVLNQYSTVNSFYRAYDLWADYEVLSTSMKVDDNYIIGELEHMVPIKRPDVSGSLPMPKGKKKSKKSERNRKRIRKEIRMENPDAGVFTEEEILGQIAAINFTRKEDILYMYMRDHLLDSLYFVGKNHCYMMDFTKTSQKNVPLFGSMTYFVAIPMDNLPEDDYILYIEREHQKYNTGKYINVQKKRVALEGGKSW